MLSFIPRKFDVDSFIRESNLIDPQYSTNQTLIPGDQPGTPMYERQKAALDIFPILLQERPTPTSLCCDLHRELTRGLAVYEDQGNSGFYRRKDVYINDRKLVNTLIAQEVIEHVLIKKIDDTRDLKLDSQLADRFSWWCHDVFICAHPYVDGNGRTARLLLNLVREAFGIEKIIVYHKDCQKYYEHIRNFEKFDFPRILNALTIRAIDEIDPFDTISSKLDLSHTTFPTGARVQ